MKVIKSKTLPCPLVILVIIVFPHNTSQTIPPIIRSRIKIIMQLMILRFLDTGFFAFFSLRFDFGVVFESVTVVVSEVFNSPSCSSKLKT